MKENNSCPDCYTTKFMRRSEYVQAYPDDPDQKNVMHSVTMYTCVRCGWKGKEGELVSTRGMSATKLGKIRARMKRRK